MNVAVVGSGISGLSAAWALSQWAHVTVFESEDRLGGHTHTQMIEIDHTPFAVDTGFIVFNHRTYPGFKKWLETLDVATAESDMSFSASLNRGELEWCGSSLNTVFAQRTNLASPRFWGMLGDILRFNREAPRDAERLREQGLADRSLGDYLDQGGYGKMFLDAYLLPMAGAIWSCPTQAMRAFPMETFTRFCENHGLLSVSNRPQWYTIRGGAQHYIDGLKKKLARQPFDVRWRLGHEVLEARPLGGSLSDQPLRVRLSGKNHQDGELFSETFDAVILACHSDQIRTIIGSASLMAKNIIGNIRYQENIAYLHTDTRLMPRRSRAWASWNYLHENCADGDSAVSVTYWMNRLQPLPVKTPVLVSLNPVRPPQEDLIIRKMHYAHPIFDGPASRSQRELPIIQGEQSIWYAGAWTRYGFHEDGFQSGLSAARQLRSRLTSEINQLPNVSAL